MVDLRIVPGGDGYAHARDGDPFTSHAAAASISTEGLSRGRYDVWWTLAELGPCEDTLLCQRYQHFRAIWPDIHPEHSRNFRLTTESSIRSRRDECVRIGIVVYAGRDEPTLHDNLEVGQVWQAVPQCDWPDDLTLNPADPDPEPDTPEGRLAKVRQRLSSGSPGSRRA